MIRRTSLNLDLDLVAQTREVLGTRTTTETIHQAMREVVQQQELRRLADWDLGGMTLDDLAQLRRGWLPDHEWPS